MRNSANCLNEDKYSVSLIICRSWACFRVFCVTLHCPDKCFTQVLDMMLMISGIEVGEPFGLDKKPDAFNGGKVGR